MSRPPSLRHRLEAAAYAAAEAGLRLLPWRACQALGRRLGDLVHLLDARHRRVVRQNLRESDLGLDEAAVRATARRCFRHFGALFCTTPKLLHATPEELDRWVKFEGLEHWDAAAALGRGFIGLTGHYGHWEAMALALSHQGRTLSVIGRELDNPLLEAKMKALRGGFGNRVILKNGAVREALKELKRGQGVGFLLDQDALTSGVFVKFLGHWASTFPTAGLLAVKYQLPVVPIFSRFEPDGTVLVTVEAPFQVPRTGDTERDVWTATQLMTRCIEDRIHRDPHCWFWMHRRFKTRPGEGNPLPAPLPPEEWRTALPAPATLGLGPHTPEVLCRSTS